jgi:2-oxoglutarate ferredoxin oxidoreductase subunit delta
MPEKTSTPQDIRDRPPRKKKAVSRNEAARPEKPYEIDIYRAWCKACGICVAFCPWKCLSVDEEGNPVVTHPERCTGCGWCEIHCPDFAISVRECPAEKPREEAD